MIGLSLRGAFRWMAPPIFPSSPRWGLKMIKAKGGIFGWVSDSARGSQGNDGARLQSFGGGAASR